MIRFVLTAAAALGLAGVASAQFQTQPYSGYQNQYPYGNQMYPSGGGSQYPAVQPNIYNPANQPLSPYLNMLRGGNPGVNYYYGVRPGTSGGFGFGLGAPFTASGGMRPMFFPQLMNAPDPLETTSTGAAAPSVLPPAGHPAVFSNTLGYFPSPYGNRGGMRPGLAGVGNRSPARR
jgi:hypothetical protein